jgi:hypothetical protein
MREAESGRAGQQLWAILVKEEGRSSPAAADENEEEMRTGIRNFKLSSLNTS